MSKDVYIPVCVTVNDDGDPVWGYIDWDGAPWMFVDSADNVWDEDEQEWRPGRLGSECEDEANTAEQWLADRLADLTAEKS
jgi:hypothetical protein